MRARTAIVVAMLLGCGCGGVVGFVYPQTTPAAATVSVQMPTLHALTADQTSQWSRYLATHPHWLVREEGGCRFAVRLEPRPGEDGPVYEGTMNGFYSDFESTGVVQTRVLTGLGCSHGFGEDRGQIVRAGAMDGLVQLVLEDVTDQPGTNSALLVSGGRMVTLEVFGQSHDDARPFTQSALVSVEAELGNAVSGNPVFPPGTTRPGPATMQVTSHGRAGDYAIEAWVNPGRPGKLYTRAVYTGPDEATPAPVEVRGREGQPLSDAQMRWWSARWIGFGDDPGVMYAYTSHFIVEEGNEGEPYRARFELWFVDEQGTESKLLEHERVVEGRNPMSR